MQCALKTTHFFKTILVFPGNHLDCRGSWANWLPIPASGSYNLTVRVYQPEQSLLDGTYKLPPVTKVD
jgi:hypothetical protein